MRVLAAADALGFERLKVLLKYELRTRLLALHPTPHRALDRVSMKTGRGRAEAKTAIRNAVNSNHILHLRQVDTDQA